MGLPFRMGGGQADIKCDNNAAERVIRPTIVARKNRWEARWQRGRGTGES